MISGRSDYDFGSLQLAYEQQHQVALPLQEWRTRNKQQQQIVIEPPKKLSVEEKKLQIKAKLTLGQPVNDHDLNQPEELTHDFNHQQLKAERTTDGRESYSESDCTIDQKNGAVRNHEYRIEQYSRAVEVKQRSTGREDYSSKSQPDRESERTKIQLHRVLEAISGYLELEEVGQQLGAFIAKVNRSRAGKYVRDQRTEGIARPVERESSAGIDSAASDGSIERQGGDPQQRATRQLLSAITDYLEVTAIVESPVANELQILTENLSQHQNIDAVMQKLETALTAYRSPETSRQALAAFAEFVEESCIESALTGTLESVIGQLSADKERSLSNQSATTNNSSKEQPLIDQAASDQALDVISSYLEQQEVLDSTIAQDLATLTEQLRARCVVTSNQQLTSVKTDTKLLLDVVV